MKVSKKAALGIFLCSKLIFETKNARNNKSQGFIFGRCISKKLFLSKFHDDGMANTAI